MRRLTVLTTALLALALTLHAQDEFKKSDPSLLSRTGRPQLVEFYHPG